MCTKSNFGDKFGCMKICRLFEPPRKGKQTDFFNFQLTLYVGSKNQGKTPEHAKSLQNHQFHILYTVFHHFYDLLHIFFPKECGSDNYKNGGIQYTKCETNFKQGRVLSSISSGPSTSIYNFHTFNIIRKQGNIISYT